MVGTTRLLLLFLFWEEDWPSYSHRCQVAMSFVESARIIGNSYILRRRTIIVGVSNSSLLLQHSVLRKGMRESSMPRLLNTARYSPLAIIPYTITTTRGSHVYLHDRDTQLV